MNLWQWPLQKWQESCEVFGLMAETAELYLEGLGAYGKEFSDPYWTALDSLQRVERRKIWECPPEDTIRDYSELFRFSMDIFKKGFEASKASMEKFHAHAQDQANAAWKSSLDGNGGSQNWVNYWQRQKQLVHVLAREYPIAIKNIQPHFGFHFDDGGYVKITETGRFILYQVMPWKGCAQPRPDGKPILIIPPYVLGASILAFLPGHNKSYVHSFANQGIPTYIRVMKDIHAHPAVQVMTGEDDCLDTKHFCEVIRARHGRQVTLNGFCQGGFVAALNIMSGELDGLVDAFATCVAPMDGTRSQALVEYLEHIPPRFRDLGYAGKSLPNGNVIVDGRVMSWVYKLKSMEREAPIFSYYRDLTMFNKADLEHITITPTAAALNYWLKYERNDLPTSITQLSFESYTIPIAKDGTLPVRLFGRTLNFRYFREKKIPWLLCYAEEDDLVNPEAALAPADFIEAEVSVFPKGHGAIATSWSHPTSACALHTRFGTGYRGPVRYQLDLEAAAKKRNGKNKK
jgi:hypothetical protein